MDFSMKNNKIVNHYFTNLKERSTITPMEVIADGTQANENPAACYRGMGCVSGNNSSRLLLDYKVEHPHAYEEIMRLLFQKDYGAGLTQNDFSSALRAIKLHQSPCRYHDAYTYCRS